ncbi:MAG TPA: hypothetical protein VNM48_19555, partial [Chloroflexota bacterium]|nr:hypothetical protein [Chloroflexota bacterium]
FVLTTKQGELTVTTSAGTNFHSPSRAVKTGVAAEESEVGREKLTFATLKVGQRVAVQGERPNNTMLLATRVHIPKP